MQPRIFPWIAVVIALAALNRATFDQQQLAFHSEDECGEDCALVLLQRNLALRGSDGAAVLVVLHDAGESLALLPVIRHLLARSLARPRLLVLPVGEPATSMTECTGEYATSECIAEQVPSVTLAELGIDISIVDGSGGRSQLLSPRQLRTLTRYLSPRISAVLTGMSYAMHLQIGAGLQKLGARFAAYYDSLSIVGNADEPAGIQIRFARIANEVWVPSLKLLPSGSEWNHTVWHAVGQPTLESWATMRDDTAALRAARSHIYGADALAASTPAAVWFGGYGSTYPDALRCWCRAARKIASSRSPGRMLFALAIHPGPYGEEDRRVLREEGVEDIIVIVPKDISGATAALASNLTVSQGSTGGEQSLFAGKPAVFVDSSGRNAFGKHLGSVLGLIPTVNNSDEAVAAVRKVASQGWTFNPELLAAAGVPLNATQQIADRILSLLRGPGARL